MTKRFDFVEYDETSIAIRGDIRRTMATVEDAMGQLKEGRAKSVALTKLEAAFMWVGKAIRDDQVARTPAPTSTKEC